MHNCFQVGESQNLRQHLEAAKREVEELKRQVEEDRGLVGVRFKETKDSLESYFKCLETIQSTQNQEVRPSSIRIFLII